MIVSLFAAAAIVSGAGLPISPVKNAKAAIKIAQQVCGKDRVYLFGKWHATLDGVAWTVWFGENPKQPVCNNEGASVAVDGSKTDCLVTVC